MKILINNANKVKQSPTVSINSIVQSKILSGKNIINLSVGEPKIPMHDLLKQSAIEAIQHNKVFYPPMSGIAELKSAAITWMKKSYGCDFKLENTLVTTGGKQGIYLLLQLIIQHGDEVIIISPHWVSYPAITTLFNGKPIIIETRESNKWKVNIDTLKKSISSKSKILIINNGSNPTGALYTRNELNEILRIAKYHELFVISDEVYSGLTYENIPYVSCGSFTQHQDHVAVIQSCSKNFSMTGWRIGFVFGNPSLIQHLTALVSQNTSGVTTVSQWVAKTAIENTDIINTYVRDEMQKRRDLMVRLLRSEINMSVTPPESSLYLFISLKQLGAKNVTSETFCTQILRDADIAISPGSAFGKEGYIRLSFSSEEQNLIQGIPAFARYLRTK